STTFTTKPHIGPQELRGCFKLADHIIVNSGFLKQVLVKADPMVKRKITVNYPGVDTERFSSRWEADGEKQRIQRLKELGYEKKHVVLFAGRLIEIKGVHHLLQAVPAIVAKFPETVFIIVGSAHYGSHEL